MAIGKILSFLSGIRSIRRKLRRLITLCLLAVIVVFFIWADRTGFYDKIMNNVGSKVSESIEQITDIY